MNVKMLATDLDGTLLDDFKRVSPKNREALTKIHDKGIQVVLCTGRPFHTVEPYLPQLNIPCWLITNNGSVIRNPGGDVVHTRYLHHKALEKVLITLGQPPKLYYHGSDNHNTYIQSRWDRMKNIYGFERRSLNSPLKATLHAFNTVYRSPIHRKVDFSSFSKEGGKLANLIVISRDLEALDIKKRQLESIEGIYLTRSGRDNLEVLDKEATKGKALLWLTEYLGLTMEEVAAIGDHDNDVSMVQMAGIGFATGNAEYQIKEQADYVTSTNNEDALWDLYQKLSELQE